MSSKGTCTELGDWSGFGASVAEEGDVISCVAAISGEVEKKLITNTEHERRNNFNFLFIALLTQMPLRYYFEFQSEFLSFFLQGYVPLVTIVSIFIKNLGLK